MKKIGLTPRQMFKALDKDSGGTLDEKEFIQGL